MRSARNRFNCLYKTGIYLQINILISGFFLFRYAIVIMFITSIGYYYRCHHIVMAPTLLLIGPCSKSMNELK